MERAEQIKREIKDLESEIAHHKAQSDTLKIVVNGSFGKLGSKWSLLYAPDLMIQTTLSGQLALQMLIERMERNGVSVVSANTDGIVVKHRRDMDNYVAAIALEWELDTGYELEENEYSAIYSRDVNNYLAIQPDGSYKGKGAYANPGLMKNPANRICVKAVVDKLVHDKDIEQTIRECNDITQFVTIRQVKGGGEKDGAKLGKAVRWYYSTETDTPIVYSKNGNKVARSDGAMPIMNLPESLPGDIDYDWYIKEANDILEDIGYA
jgi:DNA polymerase elongation subunit (family B)